MLEANIGLHIRASVTQQKYACWLTNRVWICERKSGDANLSMYVRWQNMWRSVFLGLAGRQIIAPCPCRVTMYCDWDDRNRYTKVRHAFSRNRLDLHICSPSGQTCGPELTSINTVGVQITSTQRSATLRFTRKMFVLFLMSLPRSTTNGTWGYYTREL